MTDIYNLITHKIRTQVDLLRIYLIMIVGRKKGKRGGKTINQQ